MVSITSTASWRESPVFFRATTSLARSCLLKVLAIRSACWFSWMQFIVHSSSKVIIGHFRVAFLVPWLLISGQISARCCNCEAHKLGKTFAAGIRVGSVVMPGCSRGQVAGSGCGCLVQNHDFTMVQVLGHGNAPLGA